MTSEMPLLKTRRAAIYCGESNNASAFKRGKWWRRKRRGGGQTVPSKEVRLGWVHPNVAPGPQQQVAPLKERRFRKENTLLWFNLSSHCLKKEKPHHPCVRPGYTPSGRSPSRVKLLTPRAAWAKQAPTAASRWPAGCSRFHETPQLRIPPN